MPVNSPLSPQCAVPPVVTADHTAFHCCVVIPCYNHGDGLRQVLTQLRESNLSAEKMPCFVVDDGSDQHTQQILQQLAADIPTLRLLRLPVNSGKGAAVLHGLQAAQQAGFSHALQIDADGQHALQDIPRLLEAARQHPQALISGQPLYDASMPRARRYGRWITHAWVWIETLSFSLKDSMCGFRVYPLAATLRLAARHPALGKHMDFDIEIMVRLYWQGHHSYFVPTKVHYPPDGVSHFNALKDNFRISHMHSRLFFGMLIRLPGLLFRRVARPAPLHWAQQKELAGLWGMRFMLLIYRLAGRKVFTLLLYPVVAVYWLLAKRHRAASQQWLSQVRNYSQQQADQPASAHLADSPPVANPCPARLNSYQHFLRFANAMLDKIASWRGELQFGKQVDFAPGSEHTLKTHLQRGCLLITSHLGDVEVCRALAQQLSNQPITALVFHQHAQNFKQMMDQLAPQASVNLLPVNHIGPDTAILLKQKVEAGEWVAIVADRLAIHPQRHGDWRVSWSQFVGRAAPFPQGAFILASLLHCPVLLLFALQEQRQLRIYCEPFAGTVSLPRARRQQALQHYIDRYAARLQHYALQSPLDWFNFFDFWQLPAIPGHPQTDKTPPLADRSNDPPPFKEPPC